MLVPYDKVTPKKVYSFLAGNTCVLVQYDKVTPKKVYSFLARNTCVLVQYDKVTPKKVYNFLAGNTCACAVRQGYTRKGVQFPGWEHVCLCSMTRLLQKRCTISWLGTRVLVPYDKVTPKRVYNFLARNTCACAVRQGYTRKGVQIPGWEHVCLCSTTRLHQKRCTISWLGTRVLVQYDKVTPKRVYNFLARNTCACAVRQGYTKKGVQFPGWEHVCLFSAVGNCSQRGAWGCMAYPRPLTLCALGICTL